MKVIPKTLYVLYNSRLHNSIVGDNLGSNIVNKPGSGPGTSGLASLTNTLQLS